VEHERRKRPDGKEPDGVENGWQAGISSQAWAGWQFPPEDPYPAYRAARARAAVQWNEQLNAHLVLSYEHARATLSGSDWSSDPRNGTLLADYLAGGSQLGEFLSKSLLMSDPPAHTRLRSAVNRFFTPRAVKRIQQRVAAIVDSAFAPLSDGEPIELMSEVAYPIPLAVIAELFDIGVEGAQLLGAETPKLARMFELAPGRDDLDAIGAAVMSLVLFLVPIVARRRTQPGDDLLSALIHPGDHAAPLETDEIVMMCLLLLAAGHETTANLIGNGTLALLRHPEQLALLSERPDLCAQAVEELLRYDSPVQLVSRVATSDLALGEHPVGEGELAVVMIGAANRDPAQHQSPDALDLTRARPSHLAFGNGPHFCIGAGLARLEAQETFGRLARLPLRTAAGSWSYERDSSRSFRRLRSLHVIREGAVHSGAPHAAQSGASQP
jgi:cytochrome P450